MTNKEKLAKRLETASPELLSEINYYLEDVEHDEIPDYDITDAFDDFINLVLDEGCAPRLNKETNQIYIDIGFARPVDINMVTVNKGKKYWFKKLGVYYQAASGWRDWISGHC